MSLRKLAGAIVAALISVVADAGADDTAPTSVRADSGEAGAPPELTVEQIVEKNVAARGGLEAWRGIVTMMWTGHIESGNAHAAIEPFVFELKRPNKMRFEVSAEHERSMRVFDGTLGWTTRASNIGSTLRRYTRSELKSAHDAQGIDGLLIDHQAKGIKVALAGTDQVDGHAAYRLDITLPSGTERRLWIDAQSFLEVKYERHPGLPVGRAGDEFIYYRDYRSIGRVRMPFTIEAQPKPGSPIEKMMIDKVTLNPVLSDAHFERPQPAGPRRPSPELQSSRPVADPPMMASWRGSPATVSERIAAR